MITLANRRGATLQLPPTVSWTRIPLGVSVPTVANARGHGDILVGPQRLQARQITLSGPIYYVPKTRIKDEADKIIAFLMEPPIEIYWDSERRLTAYPTGIPQEWVDGRAELRLNITFTVPDPFFYGTEVSVAEQDASSWQVEVGGTAPTLPVAKITVAAPGQDLLLSNLTNGRTLLVLGNYQAGDVVTVYTATYEATLTRSGETLPIVDALADEFVAFGFALEPDINELTYTGPTANVTLTYRPRWY